MELKFFEKLVLLVGFIVRTSQDAAPLNVKLYLSLHKTIPLFSYVTFGLFVQ